MIALSYLDQSPAIAGMAHEAVIREALPFAQACEAMGFRRYWLAEHHNGAANIGTAPEILVAAIAAVTGRIRVGTAGVLLSHYAPLKVAEQFRVLEALAPGRIDLGLGRSPGGSDAAAVALGRQGQATFDADVETLLDFLRDDGQGNGQHRRDIRAYPIVPRTPEPWVLSSSPRGAALAARLGLPYCFNASHDLNHGLLDEAVARYFADFRPGPLGDAPRLSLNVFALAADSAEHARFLYGPRGHWRLQLDRKARGGMVSPEMAARQDYPPAERERIERTLDYSYAGEAGDVARRLTALARRCDAGELVLTTWAHGRADRQRSCALIAAAMGVSA
ncbi:MsnO8 family LLM class oxidoreductase [Novosphingobium resinovorum]|uniref:MsnO8 family LLM class oxidoreductase n=1 Tax=Novosphingobium resinovorum TaxID=158500 RepID=UPI002ED2F076|nr:MsnO8 family LLM class oxidoreductase [Novosphingobium resinovorum]